MTLTQLALSPIFPGICILWLLFLATNFSKPVTGKQIVTGILFLVALVWFAWVVILRHG